MGQTVRLTSLNLDGTATLEDGREVQLIVARGGALGVRPLTREDHVATIDQSGAIPDKAYFDVSGLDQT